MKRTYATSLTDDELTLFDVLFQWGAPLQALTRRAIYGFSLHRHNIDDPILVETVRRFVDQGWMTLERAENEPYLDLTPEGGRIWELERRPDWSRFANETYRISPSGKNTVTIVATSESIREDFWRLGCETGFFPMPHGRVKRATIQNYKMVYWKAFSKFYVLIGEIGEHSPESDIERSRQLWEERTWWRFAGELAKFWEGDTEEIA